jgi:hypothetical protein
MLYKIRFRVSMVVAILLIILALTAATLGNVWLVSSSTAEKTAANLFQSITQSAHERLAKLVGETQVLVNFGAQQSTTEDPSKKGLNRPPWSLFFGALEDYPSLYSAYYGYDDGTFLQLIAAREDEHILSAHGAPAATRWIVKEISRSAAGQRTQKWTFLDPPRHPIGEQRDPSPKYDPRERPWFKNAMGGGARISLPYVFHSLQKPGITISRRLQSGTGVFAIDITLTELSRFIADQKISEKGGMILFDEKDRILTMSPHLGAHAPLAPLSSIDTPLIRAANLVNKQSKSSGIQIIEQDGAKLFVQIMNWEGDGRLIRIAVVAPLADFVAHIHTMQK